MYYSLVASNRKISYEYVRFVCEELVQAIAHLREQVAALTERLREVLNAPSDSFILAKARYVLAKIDKINQEYTKGGESAGQ